MSEIAFQPATDHDADALVTFVRELYEFDHIAFDEAVARAALKQILNDEHLGRVWMIISAGEPIGYVVLALSFSLEFHGRDAFIDELYIQASHRGRGIGTRVLEFVEGACRSLDVRALHLEVTRENTNALEFYRKFGFEDHDRYLMTRRISK